MEIIISKALLLFSHAMYLTCPKIFYDDKPQITHYVIFKNPHFLFPQFFTFQTKTSDNLFQNANFVFAEFAVISWWFWTFIVAWEVGNKRAIKVVEKVHEKSRIIHRRFEKRSISSFPGAHRFRRTYISDRVGWGRAEKEYNSSDPTHKAD